MHPWCFGNLILEVIKKWKEGKKMIITSNSIESAARHCAAPADVFYLLLKLSEGKSESLTEAFFGQCRKMTLNMLP